MCVSVCVLPACMRLLQALCRCDVCLLARAMLGYYRSFAKSKPPNCTPSSCTRRTALLYVAQMVPGRPRDVAIDVALAVFAALAKC